MPPIRPQIAIALLIAAAAPAAGEVCVTCSGPATTYACAVKKAKEIEALAGAKAINKICLQVLKRKGQHASCQVVEAASCPGTPTTIGWRDVKEALASKDDAPEPAPAKKPAAPPAQKPAQAKPLPEQPAEKAPSVNAAAPEEPAPQDPTFGEKLKTASEKTWKCVSSFFGQC